MKIIQIKAEDFFEMLKIHGVSMWDLFKNMIDGEEKQLVFLNEKNEVVAFYQLPKTEEELTEDFEVFKESIKTKINQN
ncbi:MAG: hypothetical protein RBT46_08855 [Weeksellaceae bacterium]|jgi:hypothetical protein|nr:hypothetical protein [Weeksellaceae bacterium]